MTLNITEPTVGGSSGSWGTQLNDALTAIVAYVNTVESNAQPVDTDLTAIAALTTTAYGRSLLTQANAAAAQTVLGLGTAATQASSAFDAAGAAATAQATALSGAATDATAKANAAAAASQPLDSDLTAIAALTTTAFGRSFLDRADATAARTLLGLGTLATQSGTFSGTSSGTNTGDQDLSALAPKASPALTGVPTAPTASVGTNTTQVATTAFVASATSNYETVTAVASSGTAHTFDLGSAGAATWDVTLTGNLTPTFTGAVAGKVAVWTLVLRQDATGSRTVSWPANVSWQSQAAPTLSTSNAAYDVIQVSSFDGGTTLVGFQAASRVTPYTVPGQVPSVVAASGNAAATLTWGTPSSGGQAITGYKVYRSTSSGTETLLTTLGNVNTFTDSGLTNGTTYYYKVAAVNGVGTGTQSAEASTTPAVPTGHYLNLPGTAGANASTPSTSALQVAGPIDLIVKAALNSWTPSGGAVLFGKRNVAGTAASMLVLDAAGTLTVYYYVAASGSKSATSTVTVGFTGGTTNWVRAFITPDTGSATNTVAFYTSTDGTTWTQLGTTVTNAGAGSFANDTGALFVGTQASGATPAAGKVYRTILKNNTSTVSDMDWSAVTTGSTTAVATTGETWTVNGTASVV